MGVDVVSETALLWIVRDALRMPLPPHWRLAREKLSRAAVTELVEKGRRAGARAAGPGVCACVCAHGLVVFASMRVSCVLHVRVLACVRHHR